MKQSKMATGAMELTLGLRRFLTAITWVSFTGISQTALAYPDPTLSFNNFADSRGEAFQLVGDATIDGSRIRLTRAVNGLAGSAMHATQVELERDRSFSVYFTFRMIKGPDPERPPADGIAFILHNNPTDIGVSGNGIGYKGIDHSVAVELDIYPNGDDGDPNNNHVGLSLNGVLPSVATAIVEHPLNDGFLQHAWIEYDGAAKKLEVRVSKTAVRPREPNLSHIADLSNILETNMIVGFTASTGACNAEHVIESFHFIGKHLRDGIEPPR